jgi:hypothetical protein
LSIPFEFTNCKKIEMSVLVIQGTESNQKLILALAKKIGSKAVNLKNQEIEDMLFGAHIQAQKTGKLASREAIFKVLDKS